MTTTEREEAILSLSDTVDTIIKSAVSRLSIYGITYGDLYGPAWTGAIISVDRYETHKNCSLKTFATFRIRGEIKEYLRSLDICSKHIRKQIKQGDLPNIQFVDLGNVDINNHQQIDEIGIIKYDITNILGTIISLTKKEYYVLHREYIDKVSRIQIGKELNTSPLYVQQLVSSAIKKCRNFIRENKGKY